METYQLHMVTHCSLREVKLVETACEEQGHRAVHVDGVDAILIAVDPTSVADPSTYARVEYAANNGKKSHNTQVVSAMRMCPPSPPQQRLVVFSLMDLVPVLGFVFFFLWAF